MNQTRIKNTDSSLDTYLELVELTEPPLLYHRWSFISAVSAALGRNVWVQFGEDKIFPNQFITLIGPPGARKSTAINIAANMLRDSGYEFFSGDASSKEKFLMDWSHGFDKIARGIEPGDKSSEIDDISMLVDSAGVDTDSISQAFIRAGELEDFLGAGNGAFVTTLTNIWDNPRIYTSRFKNSKSVLIPNPVINLLGGATTATFASIFNANIIGKGMLSRMILVHGKGQRMRLTIPPPLPVELRKDIVELLYTIRTGLQGPVSLTSGGYNAYDSIYKNFNELQDARLISYSARRHIHLLKLCLVIAASDLSLEITEEVVIAANTILSYTEIHMPKALGEFGKNRNSEVTQVVLDAISGEPEGLTLDKLLKLVGHDIDSVHDLTTITLKLRDSGKIETHEIRNGRPVLRAVKGKVVSSSKYVNFNLLYEYRFKEAE